MNVSHLEGRCLSGRKLKESTVLVLHSDVRVVNVLVNCNKYSLLYNLLSYKHINNSVKQVLKIFEDHLRRYLK